MARMSESLLGRRNSGILRYEIVFGDDGDAQLLGLLVLARGGGDVIINKVGRRTTDSRSNLAALRLDIGLEFVAVLVVVDVASNDEGKAGALVARH